jgi:hypothetical protein
MVEAAPDAVLVPLGPGMVVESPQIATYDWKGYDLELVVTAEPAGEDRVGRFVCSSLTMRAQPGGPPVTSEAIRSVPVSTMVKRAGARTWQTVEFINGAMSLTDARLTPEMVERLRLRGPVDESLQWVARIYRSALVFGDPPTRAVEATLGLPRSTAGRWVSMARDKGFLGASEGQGRIGG